VEFGNGSVFNLSAEFLRVHSPAVDAKIRSIAGEKAITPFSFLTCNCWNKGVHIIFEYCYHIIENRSRK
jgi:hypothetical protein